MYEDNVNLLLLLRINTILLITSYHYLVRDTISACHITILRLKPRLPKVSSCSLQAGRHERRTNPQTRVGQGCPETLLKREITLAFALTSIFLWRILRLIIKKLAKAIRFPEYSRNFAKNKQEARTMRKRRYHPPTTHRQPAEPRGMLMASWTVDPSKGEGSDPGDARIGRRPSGASGHELDVSASPWENDGGMRPFENDFYKI